MWLARTKNDLIIEVWEKLDCESIGSSEVEAIEAAVADKYGAAAVDSPMVIARLLADEGAELRHSEIMALYVKRAANRPYDAAILGVGDIHDLKSAAAVIKNLENLRRKYSAENDRGGLRVIRETAIRLKAGAAEQGQRLNVEAVTRLINSEIAQWLTVWLQTPEVFEGWLTLRQRSPEFHDKFGRLRES